MNVIVMGRAKTGTTIIAKTIQASLDNASFLMEPKSLNKFLEPFEEDVVAKLIFEHWSSRPYSRLAILNNELGLIFDKRIFIVRDPRDELISRMFYVVYGHLKEGKVDRQHLIPWLEMVKAKESKPRSISVCEMLALINKILGVNMSLAMNDTVNYYRFLARHGRHSFLLRYENFMENKIQDLENYLGFALTQERDVGKRFNRTRRSAACNNWKTFFVASDLEQFKILHADDMKLIGFDDWALSPVESLNPEHGSIYLERILDEALRRRLQSSAPELDLDNAE
jgi:hypothetical protein